MLFAGSTPGAIILGLNTITLNLARRLSQHRDIIMITRGASPLENRLENTDIILRPLEENLAYTLKQIITDQYPILLALTKNQEYNLFTTRLARQLGVRHSLALTFCDDYSSVNRGDDLSFNIYQVLADKILLNFENTGIRRLQNLIPGTLDVSQLVLRAGDTYAGKKLKEITPDQGLIIAINKQGRTYIAGEETRLFAGDKLYLLHRVTPFKNFPGFPRKRLFILGGKGLGSYLVQYYQHLYKSIIIIEPSLKKCQELAMSLEKPIILHGHGSELELFRQEGLQARSNLLAGGEDDLENLITSFAASRLDCRHIVTLLDNHYNLEIAGMLALSNIVFVPGVIADYLTPLLDNNFQIKYVNPDITIRQVNLSHNSSLHNKKIDELVLPPETLVGAIINKGKVKLTRGQDTIQPGDSLLVIYHNKLEKQVIHFFQS